MTKYKVFENRKDAFWTYTERDKDQVIKAVRKMIRQAIKDAIIHPIDKTAIMKLGTKIEEDIYSKVVSDLQEGKYNQFIRDIVLGD
jgi:flagellar biosynthesis component FlhA